MKKASLIMIILWGIIGLLITAALITGIFVSFGVDLFSIRFNAATSLLVEESVLADDLDNIRIELAADNCIVSVVDDSHIRIRHYGANLPESEHVRLIESGSGLEITTHRRGISFPFSYINRVSRVEIDLPESYNDKLVVDAMSGTITIDDELDLSGLDIDIMSGKVWSNHKIKATIVNIDAASGEIKLNGGLISEDYSIDLVSGNITVGNTVSGSGNIEITSGTLTLEGVDISDSLDIGVVSGTANIEIAGEPSVKFSGERVSGTIDAYFDIDKSGSTVSASVGDGPYKNLSAEVVSGTVRITQDK